MADEARAILAPRAGFEPATIRLTVECSTAELPRNRRNLGVRKRERITKPPRLAKDEIGLSGVPVRAKTSYLCHVESMQFCANKRCGSWVNAGCPG